VQLAQLVEQFQPGALESGDVAAADVQRGEAAEGVGDAGQRIRGVRLQLVAASAELVLALSPAV
jgi:hypothetical protein